MFSFFHSGRNNEEHPSGDDLLLYVDGELPSRAADHVRLHLETCWACRLKAEKVGETISAFMEYRSRALLPNLQPPREGSGSFHSRLHALATETQPQRQTRGNFAHKLYAFIHPVLEPRVGIPGSAVAMALIAAIWFTYVWTPPLTASTLLDKSVAVENAKGRDSSLVLHHGVRVEKHKAGESTVLSRWHVDTWHSGERGVTVQRLYDDSGNIVAGAWNTGSNATIYQHTAHHWVESAKRLDAATFDNPDDIWQFDFSATSFKSLIADPSQASIQKQSDRYVVTYKPQHATGNLLKASLTVGKADLHPLAIELTVNAKADAASTQSVAMVYSMVEDHYEEKPVRQVQAQVFQPEPEMLAANTAPAFATADMLVQTTYQLDRIGATLGKQVTATLGADHKLHIDGIVADRQRKAEILGALASLASNPAVKVNIMTYAEASRSMAAMPAGPVNSVSDIGTAPGENVTIPVYRDLSHYFEVQGTENAAQIPQEVRRFSQEVTGDSRTAMRHAWALKGLVDSISPDAVSSLSTSARADYFCMISGHVEEIGKDTERVRRQLDPVFYANASSENFDPEAHEKNLTQAVGHLFETVSRNDGAVQSSFTLTAGSGNRLTVKDPAVRESLLETERLVGWVRTVSGMNDCGGGTRRAHR